MSLDDDLFEDNEVIVDAGQPFTLEDEPVNSDMSSLAPEYQRLVRVLRDQFSNVNSFSFSLFSEAYLHVLEQIQHIYHLTSDTTAPQVIAPDLYFRSDSNLAYGDFVGLIEIERNIMNVGFFNEIIGHAIAQLKDHPTMQDEEDYAAYTYQNFLKEYALSTSYLARLIDNYEVFCNKHGLTIDENLAVHQIKSHLTVIERQVYGHNVPAFEIEMVGAFPDANDIRDKSNSSHAESIVEFVLIINKVTRLIRDGSTSEIQEYFS